MQRCVCAALAAFLAACAQPASLDGLTDVIEERPDRPPIAPFDRCVVTTARDESESAAHVGVCSELPEGFSPPSSGPHYAMWADFARYDSPVPYGFLIHSLEHGAIVLVHRGCEADCPEVLEAFERIRRSVADPRCRDHDNGNRVIITVDPALETPIAALAWEHVYTATCLDDDSLSAFVDAHYAQAPEDFCTPGITRAAGAWCP